MEDIVYLADIAKRAVEEALGISFIVNIPSVRVTNDLPLWALGSIDDNEILIKKDLPRWQAERTLCHELIHFAGVDSEEEADRLEIKAWCLMPIKK